MAIYRPERAQLSVHGEAGHGGYLDYISAVTDPADWTGLINLAAHLPAGSRSVTFDGASGTLAVGNYIQLGATATGNAEIRRIASLGSYNGTAATGTVILDYPTGFFHSDNEVVDEKTIDTNLAGNSFSTFLPGVYETVNLPDPGIEMTPRYFLGSTARNWYVNYRNRKSLVGSLPSFTLLNGFPLRFPIGTVRTVASAYSGGSTTLSLAGGTFKGERRLPVTDGTSFANGDFIEIEQGGTNPEVRQIISGASGAGAQTFILNYPMMFAHANGVNVLEVNTAASSFRYEHTMVETADLDSLTWHLLMRDSDGTAANDFIRRYVGGMISRATLSADEGGMLMMSWDEVPFLDIVHNQSSHSGIAGGMPFYSASLIAPTGVGGAIPHSAGVLGTATFPTTQPYYFSQGSISLFGIEFARIRRFRIEISNNVESRYYIRDNARERVPAELVEQRRQYSMAADVALPDSLAATATTRTLFKELLVEGNYDAGFTGFDVSLTFTRTATTDRIVITIPPSAAAAGGDAQGVFITRAPHAVGTEAPIQVPVEMLFRGMSVVVRDSVAVYP